MSDRQTHTLCHDARLFSLFVRLLQKSEETVARCSLKAEVKIDVEDLKPAPLKEEKRKRRNRSVDLQIDDGSCLNSNEKSRTKKRLKGKDKVGWHCSSDRQLEQ